MNPSTATSAYDFEFETIEGGRVALSQFKGKVLLVINTASKCGFTPQYAELYELQKKYGSEGFSVLAVPSNDFKQELGSNEAVKSFCLVNYLVNFPIAAITHVRGKNAHPFFKWAKKQGGLFSSVHWNFHKYLVGPDGQLLNWYFTTTKPKSRRITSLIEKYTGHAA